MAARDPDDDGSIDAAAAYKDPRAVPLSKAVELLDLRYPDQTAAEAAAEAAVRRDGGGQLRLRGQLRLLGYEQPRRRSDPPVLVPLSLVRRAFEDHRSDIVHDPVHDRLHIRPNVIGSPPAGFQETPDGAERSRELRRLAALPPAVDWRGCRLRAGRYTYVNVKVIRAADLVDFRTVRKLRRRPGARLGKRRTPKDARSRLDKMIHDLSLVYMEAAEAAEVLIKAYPELLYSRRHEETDEEEIVNCRGWWTYDTLVRNVSRAQASKRPR